MTARAAPGDALIAFTTRYGRADDLGRPISSALRTCVAAGCWHSDAVRDTSVRSIRTELCRRQRCSARLAAAGLALLVAGAVGAQETRTLEPLDRTERITYFIAAGAADSSYRETDRDLAVWALEAWARGAEGALDFVAADESSAMLRIYWVPASAGQYGEMRPIDVGGRRGAAVYVRPDTDALGPEIGSRARLDALFRDTIVYLTCLHELGHALGLTHTADYRDVMYFFGHGGDIPRFFGRYRDELRARGDIRNVSGLSSGDLSRLRALYPR